MFSFFGSKNSVSGKLQELKQSSAIPNHIAIIMDGNARWAKARGLPTQIGHKVGTENVAKITESCIEFGIKFLSLYAFSSENWQRPKSEVDYLMNLLGSYIDSETKNLIEKNIKVLVSGDLSAVSFSLVKKIEQIKELTKNNSAITLNVAFSYGARQEIVNAARKIAVSCQKNEVKIDSITEEIFAKNLYQPEIPDPDLLIRTAGDLRLSNFMLWQAAYSELYFTPKFWPDFSKEELQIAISEFNLRERRYGKRS